jgi:hypothetical protein
MTFYSSTGPDKLSSTESSTSTKMRFFKLALTLAGALAAVGYAAPTAASLRDVSNNTATTDGAVIECGYFLKIEEEGDMPLYANGHYENLELFTHMIGIFVEKCGICMAFP